MAELLLRVVDKVNPNALELDCQLTKRGYVIVVQEDGWPWSVLELNSPHWCLLKVPGVPVDHFTHLLTPEPETDPEHPNPYLQARANMLDIDSVTDGTSFEPPVVITTTEDFITSITVAVPAINNPHVIGASPRTIG